MSCAIICACSMWTSCFCRKCRASIEQHAERVPNWPAEPQYEFLAHEVWQDYAYGRNAVYDHGHHGNAILSRFPIVSAENQDVSAHRFEHRGLLHCEVALGDVRLHCLCVHFGLYERGRRRQLSALTERVQRLVPAGAPLIVAGDFNDWRNSAGRELVARTRPEGGVPRSARPAGAHLSEHFPAAAPGPHLRARLRRAPRRSAPRPALVAHFRSRRAERRARTAMTLEFSGGNTAAVAHQRQRLFSGAAPGDRRRAQRDLPRNLYLRRRRHRQRHRRGAGARRGARREGACARRRLRFQGLCSSRRGGCSTRPMSRC